MLRSTLLVTLGLCSCIGVGAGFAAHEVLPASPVVRGLRIGDRFVPEKGSASAWLMARRAAIRTRVVHLRHIDRTFQVTLGEAGVDVDVAATLEQAEVVGHRGPLSRRLHETGRARQGLIDIPLVWYIDRGKATALFERLRAEIDRPPIDARLDMKNRRKIPDVPGLSLDIEASIDALARGSHDDEETIDLAVRRSFARVSVDDLIGVDVEKVVSSFETTFTTRGTGAGRAVNIRNAVAKIDGIILAPGAVLSFNDTVGPRTVENGFTIAPEILGDEMTPGIGGGTCQVSSTLYAAALFGALDVIDRQSHSKPSSYTKLGLDATVTYPRVDLKIKNTLSFPVMIHAYLPKPTAVRVEILGGDPVATVEYGYDVGETEDFFRRITVKPSLPSGRRVLHQKGSRGYEVTSFVKIRYYDGRVEARHYSSEYRPFPEVYWVAPDYNEADLPPLPEHAKGVEGQMTTIVSQADESDSYPM